MSYIRLAVKQPMVLKSLQRDKGRQKYFRIRLPISAESAIQSSTLLREVEVLTVIEQLKEEVEHINSKRAK